MAHKTTDKNPQTMKPPPKTTTLKITPHQTKPPSKLVTLTLLQFHTPEAGQTREHRGYSTLC